MAIVKWQSDTHSVHRGRRSPWGIILPCMVAIPLVLAAGVIGYWHYLTWLPPYHPEAPVMPEPNGRAVALAALSRYRYSGDGSTTNASTATATPTEPIVNRPPIPVGWLNVLSDQLQAQLIPMRPILDDVRTSLALQWREPPPQDGILAPDGRNAMFRECARCFCAESRLAQSRDLYGEALQRSLDGMELGSLVSQGGGLITRYVALAGHAISFSEAEKVALLAPRSAVPAALDRVRRIHGKWETLPQMFETERRDDLALLYWVSRETRKEPLHRQRCSKWLWPCV